MPLRMFVFFFGLDYLFIYSFIYSFSRAAGWATWGAPPPPPHAANTCAQPEYTARLAVAQWVAGRGLCALLPC